jgi:D-hexose-6-phosphate mutarotase
MWPNHFKLRYTISLSDDDDSLTCRLVLVNLNKRKSLFHQAALHTYFGVSHIDHTRISGDFRGQSYIDKADGNKFKTETRDVVTVPTFTDAVYFGSHKTPITVQCNDSAIQIVPKEGFEDAVVWNPYSNPNMKQVTNWRDFVCVESAMIKPKEVKAGGEWIGEFSLKPRQAN